MAGDDQLLSQNQNIAQQIGQIALSLANAAPVPTTTASPKFWGFNNLGTTAATTVLSNSTTRHGLYFHVPSTSAQVLIWGSTLATTPTTAAPGGGFLILGGGSLPLPSSSFPNANCSWLAMSLTGSNQPLTIVEFF